jgi:hypothetical protein
MVFSLHHIITMVDGNGFFTIKSNLLLLTEMVFSLKQINDIIDGNGITSSLVDFMSFFMNNTIVDGNDIAFSLS